MSATSQHVKIRSQWAEAEQFDPDRKPWPAGVFDVEKTGDRYVDINCHCVETADGTVYVNPGDWVATLDGGDRVVITDADLREIERG